MLAIRRSFAGWVIDSCGGSSIWTGSACAACTTGSACPTDGCGMACSSTRSTVAAPNPSAGAELGEQDRLGQDRAFEVAEIDALVDRVVLALLVRCTVDQDLGVGQGPSQHGDERHRS